MGNRLYVGNLSFNTTAATVQSAFAACGEVREVALPTDRETGQPRGFAFVTMGTDNEALQAIYEEARVKGQAQQVEIYLAKAKTATDSRQEAVAISFLKQAIPYDPADPSAFFRVGMWALNKENDQRTALQLLRRAVEKAPLNADYRVALGDLYATLTNTANARREYQSVLDRDKKNAAAKAGMSRL